MARDPASTRASSPTEPCLVCAATDLEPLCRVFSAHAPGLRRRIAICGSCGHVQLFPMLSEGEQVAVNRSFFSEKFGGRRLARGGPSSKRESLDFRLGSRLSANARVLDVGAGEGWLQDLASERGCDYSAIEPIESLAQEIALRGGRVIGRSLDETPADENGVFDVVVFRHALEHVLRPAATLARLRDFLRPEGTLYVAVPNPLRADPRKGFRTSYLRPTHVSYFCAANLRRLGAASGLRVVEEHVDREITMLFARGSMAVEEGSCHDEYRSHFLRLARDTLWIDARKLAELGLWRVKRSLRGALGRLPPSG